MPDFPEATSFSLTKDYHVKALDIVDKILDMMQIEDKFDKKELESKYPHDVPGDWFTGPF